MNAEFRRQIGKWTREAMVRTAGHVTGGRVFGYDNLKVDGHVERRINEAQADVVRRRLCALRDRHGLHPHRQAVERRTSARATSPAGAAGRLEPVDHLRGAAPPPLSG